MLFDTLHDMTLAQIDATADALDAGRSVATMVDPSGIYVVMTSSAPALPYELDFVAVRFAADGSPLPAGMSAQERDRLVRWGKKAVPAICRRWKVRHPTVTTAMN